MMGNKYSTEISFLDLLFNLLLVFIALFLLALILITPPKTESNIEKSVQYTIMIRWDSESIDDVDLWLTDGNERVGFTNKQGSNFFLDRDDLGPDAADEHMPETRVNEESMSILGRIPGTYTASVHLYNLRFGSTLPLSVNWILAQVKPDYKIIKSGAVEFTSKHEEVTIIRFDIDNDGKIDRIDTDNQYPFILKENF